ncbi:GPMC system family 4 glycosyltransferase [Desulfuromonas carbonis]|uniref:glycosyltransferase n=1 Tax=Desulfuromonas sp. DDH964 TaxID=1823759 RepID=UPI00078E20C7|nr:glycosyltransferase [Desulfuromonas sp. DDH964]AMV73295.1 glycosyltransferase [Desulfuromonas sp. DDH964]
MRILIVLPEQDRATGNWVTAERFARGLRAGDHQVELCATPLDPAPLRTSLAAFRPELALLLHAYRSGRPWREAGGACPFLVLLTGTDLNQGLSDQGQSDTIRRVLGAAATILLQNPLLVARFQAELPELTARLQLLPAAVEPGTLSYPLRERHQLPEDRPLLLFPAGIRPVKGQRELLALLAPLAADLPPFHLACCGPLLDADYGRSLLTDLAAAPWADYIGIIPPAAMAAALRQSDLVLNHSRSEGLPNALLEAATLGVPILARAIPGNAAVVTPGINGLLYRDGAEFAAQLRRLLEDPAYRNTLSRPTTDYDPAQEAAQLDTLCRQSIS